LRWIDRIVEAFVAMVMAIMVLTVFGSVIFRYVLSSPLGWSEEVSRVTLVWVTLAGSYLAYRRGSHMRMSAMVDTLHPQLRTVLVLIGRILTALFLTVLIQQGYLFAQRFVKTRTEGLGISASYYYAILPVGGILLFLAVCAHISSEVELLKTHAQQKSHSEMGRE
jgi:TRAP-type C4-dicarboxylate transport system permease small subunit